MSWFRKVVRRHTKPIALPTADRWKRRLSIIYGLLAWNAFGFVLFAAYNGKADWAKFYGLKSDDELRMSPAQQFAQTLNIPKAKVLKFQGMEKTQEYEIDRTGLEDEIKEVKKESS